ncbi:isoprenoid synthase domain-containing protein [Colletotrichum phormii]|uniref:Terpene synthase n=1 Tax=Colletotrichum phormii TaxID=359342 RepID=A0AAJ0EIR1_9PEZI|nr:isoprenoid synthase domain-containing protein [Colletotrichum phormii]KAK1638321.1 isoprenoid synthase domain-containing protein [Colletotrichum phormii]
MHPDQLIFPFCPDDCCPGPTDANKANFPPTHSANDLTDKQTPMDKQTSGSQAVVKALKGQTLHVPNLYDIFKGWPVKKTNPHYKRMIPIVEEAFDRLIKSPLLREKYREANYARFVSLYYPHPDWEQVQTLALYIIWLFCWDDAIDQQGSDDLSSDLLRAKTRHDNTIIVLEHVLDLSFDDGSVIQYDHANTELKAIGAQLLKAYTREQRQTFMNQMKRYIKNCHKEQAMRLQGDLPDIQTYSELRHGTAAVWTLCALIEYSLGENMPEHIRYMKEVQTIWEETSRGIWITNDILSLKKEIPQDEAKAESVVNAVPILMGEGKSLQQAVDTLLTELQDSVAIFELATSVLEEAAGEKNQKIIRKYCDACRCMVTGSVQFT